VLVEPSPRLPNIYHVITLDPARSPRVNAAGGDAWADYLVSPAGQRVIGEFGQATFGAPLFVPAAGQDDAGLR
jgi:tungstate transport system substrate-binding protein